MPEQFKLVVVGSSGFGRESLDVLEAMAKAGSPIQILGVVDDFPTAENLLRLQTRNIPYLGSIDSLLEQADSKVKYILGVGDPSVREMLVTKIESAGFTPFTAIHPSAEIGTQVVYSPGVVICAGTVISTNVQLGRHTHVNPNATIGHDAVLGDFVSLNPGSIVSGEVTIDSFVLIGAGATVLQQLRVGRGALVGAGSVVTRNIPPGVTVKGIPGRWND